MLRSSLLRSAKSRLAATVLAVFTVEGVVMLAAGSSLTGALADAAVVAVVTLGCGYVLMARPLQRSLTDLEASRGRLHAIFHHAPLGMVVARPDGSIEQANRAFTEMIGYSEAELTGLGWRPITHPDDVARNDEAAAEVRRGERDHYRLEKRYIRKDGKIFWANLTVSVVASAHRNVQPFLIALVEDVSIRRAADQMRRLALRVFNASGDGMLVTDQRQTIRRVNRAFTRITGYGPREVIGKTPKVLSSGRHDCGFYDLLWQKLRDEGEWRGEIWNRRKDGALYLQQLFITTLRDPDGTPTHYVGAFTDVTDSHRRLEEASFRANYDPVTGLPNRRLLLDRLAQAIEIMKRDGLGLAVMFMDLDGFKAINDTFGHAAGDELLKTVGARLRDQVRGSDTVGRLGGDEFMVISLDVADSHTAGRLAAMIIEAVSAPIWLDGSGGQEVRVGASVGIALYPRDGAETIELINRADAAMYQAKQAGRGIWRDCGGEAISGTEAVPARLAERFVRGRRLGVRELDAAQAAAFALIQHLSDVLRSSDQQTLPDILTALHQCMRSHLAAEETLLEQAGCADLVAHSLEHDQLIGGIDAILGDADLPWDDKALRVVDLTCSWLETHHANFDEGCSRAIATRRAEAASID